jgi:hypothetical protein
LPTRYFHKHKSNPHQERTKIMKKINLKTKTAGTGRVLMLILLFGALGSVSAQDERHEQKGEPRKPEQESQTQPPQQKNDGPQVQPSEQQPRQQRETKGRKQSQPKPAESGPSQAQKTENPQAQQSEGQQPLPKTAHTPSRRRQPAQIQQVQQPSGQPDRQNARPQPGQRHQVKSQGQHQEQSSQPSAPPPLAKSRQAAPQAQRPAPPVQRVQQGEERNLWQQHRAHSWQSEHRSWGDRGGYDGYRIPDNRFHGYFGHDHGFRIFGLSLETYGNYPRFQYDGFWFVLLDPWPEYWSDDWYENDDVYIDYSDDGYYLYNRRHPGIGIAISVELN